MKIESDCRLTCATLESDAVMLMAMVVLMLVLVLCTSFFWRLFHFAVGGGVGCDFKVMIMMIIT